jgi:formylglycine-generating enzyme required for sulfatase activity
MASIATTTFDVGCSVRDLSCAPTEKPRHSITVQSFQIDRTEVTQSAYVACVAAGSCQKTLGRFDPEDRPRRPVTGVTWDQARNFCRWIGKRLPTEAEWELAARGTDDRVYPWGDERPSCDKAHTHECGDGPADVDERPAGASPFGVMDMAGNVDEWVEDAYVPYGSAAATQPSGERVARGGAYDAWHSRSTARSALQPDYHDALVGFRCAVSR